MSFYSRRHRESVRSADRNIWCGKRAPDLDVPSLVQKSLKKLRLKTSIHITIRFSITMFSIRSLARSAPRSLARCSAPPMRTFLSVPKPSPLQKTLSILPVRTRAAFSTVSPRFQDQEGSGRLLTLRVHSDVGPDIGAVDSELSAKLQSELQNEREATASDDLPPHLKEYLDSSPFEVR